MNNYINLHEEYKKVNIINRDVKDNLLCKYKVYLHNKNNISTKKKLAIKYLINKELNGLFKLPKKKNKTFFEYNIEVIRKEKKINCLLFQPIHKSLFFLLKDYFKK